MCGFYPAVVVFGSESYACDSIILSSGFGCKVVVVALGLPAIELVPGSLAAPGAVHGAGRAAGCFPLDSAHFLDGPLQATDIAV